MSFDISSFIYEHYRFKQYQYSKYVSEGKCSSEEACFQQKDILRAWKTHKSRSRDILNVCQSVLDKCFYYNDVHVIPVSVFQLRQLIEIRILECLGIKGIYDNTEHLKLNTRITGNHLLNVPEIKNEIIFPVSTSTLENIYGWACGYVHRGWVDNYWMVSFIQEYLVDFVCRPTYMSKDFFDNRQLYIASANNINVSCIDLENPLNTEIISDQRKFENMKNEIKKKGYEYIFQEREMKHRDTLMNNE